MMRFWPAASACAALCGVMLGGCTTDSAVVSGTPQNNQARFTEFAVPGAGNDPSSVPAGVWPDDCAGDSGGNIWFAEHHSNEIGRMSAAGVYTAFPVPTPNAIMDGIVIDNTRKVVWVSETAANKLARVDMATGNVTEITLPRPNSVPGDLILARNDTIWFTEGYEGGSGATRIGNLNQDTMQITEYAPTTPRDGTDGLQEMPNGDIWFVEYANNQIARLSKGVITEFPMPRPNVVPTNIAIDGNQMIWITEQAGNAIAEYNPLTSAWKEIPVPTAGGDPSGILADKNNNIWFTEYDTGKIGVIPAGSKTAADYAIPTPSSGPEDIEQAPNGSIIFTEQTGNKVAIISVPGLTP